MQYLCYFGKLKVKEEKVKHLFIYNNNENNVLIFSVSTDQW